jgi:hypothetical protein
MAAMTTTYRVLAKRWDKGWELHIDGVGVTQARKWREAVQMASDLIVRRECVPEGCFNLDWSFEVSDDLDAEVKAARAAVASSAVAQEEAAAQSRAVARKLRDEGLSGTEVAAVLDVSPQRVSQLLKARTIVGLVMMMAASLTAFLRL